MKKKHLNLEAQQLNLFERTDLQPGQTEQEEAQPIISTVTALISLPGKAGLVRRDMRGVALKDMIFNLLEWGKEHDYPELQFAIGHGHMGDYRGGVVQAGKQSWIMLQNADYEFVAAALAVAKEQPVPAGQDIEAMGAWVLNWGARHAYPGFSFPLNQGPLEDRHNGLVWNGCEQWLENIGSQQRCEDYPGHWLQKCIEHIKRFDSGECEIPAWNFSGSQTGKEANGRKKSSTH